MLRNLLFLELVPVFFFVFFSSNDFVSSRACASVRMPCSCQLIATACRYLLVVFLMLAQYSSRYSMTSACM